MVFQSFLLCSWSHTDLVIDPDSTWPAFRSPLSTYVCCPSPLLILACTSDQDSAYWLVSRCLHDLWLFLTPILPMIWCLLDQLLLNSAYKLAYNWTWRMHGVPPGQLCLSHLIPTLPSSSLRYLHTGKCALPLPLQTLSQLPGVLRQKLWKMPPASYQALHTGIWHPVIKEK